MEELIKVQVKNDRQLVSARDLYKGLEIKTRFSLWVKQNFKAFEEGQDFTSVVTTTEVQNNGGTQRRELQDYLLTIDTAKELCMMSKTEKGKEVRKYFIQVEKKWNSPEMVMHRALEFSNARIEQLKLENKNLNIQLEESNKKASYLDLILGDPTPILITQIANDYGYSAVAFNRLLKKFKVQRRVNGQWILYRAFMGKGYTSTKSKTYEDHHGKLRTKIYTVWTQKGRRFIYDILKKNGILPLIERED
ncbi:phage antirepressor KilAC domain-containing protein [Lactobacillus crispatus]|uniref:phage antirepressor KilAC domain-containing protein n=1 Tax=Lactobacillus crispatus TaxID=47770 RepID=UPI003F24BCBC